MEIKLFGKLVNINKDFLKIFVFSSISLFSIGLLGKVTIFILLITTYFILIVTYLINKKESIKNIIVFLLIFFIIYSTIAVLDFNENISSFESRIAKVFNINNLDPNGDGFLNNQLKNTIEKSNWFSELEDKDTYFGLYDGGDITALSTIIVYYGKFFAGIIILSIILLSLKLIYNVKQIKDVYGKLIVTGLTSIILLQAFINILHEKEKRLKNVLTNN